jgi:hypothetical protein
VILKSANIKRIHIIATNGKEPTKVTFEVFQPLKKKKLTSTWFPELLGLSDFNTKGDKVLQFYNFMEKEDIDDYYKIRGLIAEALVVENLKKKNYKVIIFKDSFDAFKYNPYIDEIEEEKQNKLNTLYKYFGGLPDIVYENKGETFLLEVKSKEMSKREYVEKNPPKTEIMQGRMLGLLYGVSKVGMTYVLFSDELQRKIYATMTAPFDLKKSFDNFFEKYPILEYKKDYEIVLKNYDIKPNELLQEMKEAYKYADGFRQTLTVPFDDLSSDMRRQILNLEREIEEENK